jgi:enamine deaminase RidA (YjgF/YER057c/UK114 family)
MAAYDVSTSNARLIFDTVVGGALWSSCYKIDTNHFINFWSSTNNIGYVQSFTVNTSTWAVTTANTRLQFDGTMGTDNSCYQIDANHFINFWGGGNSGFAEVFTVNTTTWAVTTAAARLEFDTAYGFQNSCYQVDANHFINFWGGSGNDGFVETFTVNTTTWAVTTAAARLEFDTVNGEYNSCFKIDTNHFINFWNGSGDDGFVETFTVNTTTWAVTTAAEVLEFDTQNCTYNSCYKIDTNHFINFYSGLNSDGYVQTFTVNTTTWAVTTAAEVLEFDTVWGFSNDCYPIDANHFINFWAGEGLNSYVQVFTVNTSTWAVTTAAARLEFDTVYGTNNSCYQIDSSHFINFWRSSNSESYVQVFAVELDAGGTDYPVALDEALALVSTDTQGLQLLQSITNNLSLLETPTTALGLAQSLTDNLSLSQTQTASLSLDQAVTEALAMIDSETNSTRFTPSITDTLSLQETITSLSALINSITDNLGLSEISVGGLSLSQTLTESLGLIEVESNVMGYRPVISDSLVGVESMLSQSVFSSGITEALSLSDTTTGILNAIATINEVMSGTEELTTETDIAVNLIEEINEISELSESLSEVSAFNSPITESLANTEALTSPLGINSTIAETLSLSETETAVQAINTIINESLSNTESLTSVSVFSSSITDSLANSETLTTTIPYSETITDALGLSEAQTTGLSLEALIEEVTANSDSVSVASTFIQSVADTLKIVQELWGDWWGEKVKNKTTMTNQTKNSTSWTNQNKSETESDL